MKTAEKWVEENSQSGDLDSFEGGFANGEAFVEAIQKDALKGERVEGGLMNQLKSIPQPTGDGDSYNGLGEFLDGAFAVSHGISSRTPFTHNEKDGRHYIYDNEGVLAGVFGDVAWTCMRESAQSAPKEAPKGEGE